MRTSATSASVAQETGRRCDRRFTLRDECCSHLALREYRARSWVLARYPLIWFPGYPRNSESTLDGSELAWANIAIPACCKI
jgi:hypothetical protein